MTHDDFVRIEWSATRSMNAIRQFADKDTRRDLDRAAFILAKVRNAAQDLCDPNSSGHADATAALLDIFKFDF